MKRFATSLFVAATLTAAPAMASPLRAAPPAPVMADDPPPYGCYYIFDFLYCVDVPIE